MVKDLELLYVERWTMEENYQNIFIYFTIRQWICVGD
jgi:hypothetical protein